jgi:hypothetical protein
MHSKERSRNKLWLACVAAGLLLTSPGAQAQITDGLVAHWAFEDNFQDTMGQWNGEPQGAEPIQFVEGQPGFGRAIKLSGPGANQFVEIPNSSEGLAFQGGSMSISGWFKVDSFDVSWQALIAKGEGTNWRVHRRDASQTIAYAGGAGETAAAAAPNINDGQWHHFAAVTDPATGHYLWIDGTMYEHQTTLPNLAQNAQNVMIGENPDARGRYWNGLVDDIAIWDRVLTEDEIALLSAAPLSSLLEGADFITFRAATADPASFTVVAVDIGAAVADPATVTVTLDGQPITPTVTKVGNLTTIRYNVQADQGTFFESGSEHPLSISLQTTAGETFTSEQTFTVAPYATIPADYALATPPTTPGWVIPRVHQITEARGPGDANSVANAEMQLAGGMRDAQGEPLPNIAEFPGPLEIGGAESTDVWWTPYVNWERSGGQINATGAQPDNFNAIEPEGEPGTAAGAYVNWFTPGVELGQFAEPENYVVETIAYVQLDAGLHRWGVNSDDGFRVTVAPGQPSPFGLVLGQFDGGRGAADTLFDFVVEETGYYPVRLLYWQGGGGASAEWFSVDIETGQRILIGDTQYYPGDAYEVFRTGQGRAHVRTLRPSSGFSASEPTGPVFVEIVDGRTQASNARLIIEGQEVATGTKAGNVTTINYTPETPWPLASTLSGQIVFDETGQDTPRTNHFTFGTRIFGIADLPAGSFWIEAEDFDYGGGQHVAEASTMPYGGGAYQGLNPVLNVDYFDTEMGEFDEATGTFTDGVTDYRGQSRTGPNPILSNIAQETGGTLTMTRPGGFTMTTNYKIGWVGGDNWWNFTRNVPAGNYRAMAAQSIDGGTGVLMTSTLGRVTQGAGTANQTIEPLGTFRGTGSTGWSQNALIPLLTANTDSAPLAVFTLPGGPVTFRWNGGAGDLDWMVLIPTTDEPPVDDLEIGSISIAPDGRIQIEWTGPGTLQATGTLPAADWTDITSTSPALIDPPAEGAMFFRLQQP